MANWGDFIKEMPIINKRSEGIFVKADHVLDLWDERNRLRVELAQALTGGGGGVDASAVAEAVLREREACASEIEEMAEALAGEPEPQEQLIQMLHAVARLIRDKGTQDAPMAEEIADAPMAEELAEAPLAEPVEGVAAPLAEPLPWEKPEHAVTGEEQAAPWMRNEASVAENLEREGLPPG